MLLLLSFFYCDQYKAEYTQMYYLFLFLLAFNFWRTMLVSSLYILRLDEACIINTFNKAVWYLHAIETGFSYLHYAITVTVQIFELSWEETNQCL